MDFSARNSVWLTTLRPDGSPHTTPVWFVFSDERFWLANSWSAVKVKNMQRDPRVSLAVDGTEAQPAIAQGRAVLRTDFDALADVIDAFKRKYGGWDPIDPSLYGPRVLTEVPVERWLMQNWGG